MDSSVRIRLNPDNAGAFKCAKCKKTFGKGVASESCAYGDYDICGKCWIKNRTYKKPI